MTKKKKSKRDEPVCSVEYKELSSTRNVHGNKEASNVISQFEAKIAEYLSSNMKGYKDVSRLGVADASGLRVIKVEFESLDGLVDGKIYRECLWGEEFVGVKANFRSNKEDDLEKYLGLAKIVDELSYFKCNVELSPEQKHEINLANRFAVAFGAGAITSLGLFFAFDELGYMDQAPRLSSLCSLSSGLGVVFLSYLLAKKLFPEPQAKIKESGVSESSGSGIPPAAILKE